MASCIVFQSIVCSIWTAHEEACSSDTLQSGINRECGSILVFKRLIIDIQENFHSVMAVGSTEVSAFAPWLGGLLYKSNGAREQSTVHKHQTLLWGTWTACCPFTDALNAEITFHFISLCVLCCGLFTMSNNHSLSLAKNPRPKSDALYLLITDTSVFVWRKLCL